ncbi:MAG: hypothetical protein K6G26_07575 [Lachnospiraceae bacterium]|nr:hypothetical protein [Lachnospiraceae bacterium]
MNYKRIWCFIAPVCIIVLMIFVAEVTGEKEIIFPEIAAIAVGMFMAPKRSWQTSKVRVLILIIISAVLGLGISILLPFPLWIKMALGFFICQFILAYSGTGFAPLISATVLPVLLGTRSMVYLMAAIVLTSLIILVRVLFEKLGLKEYEQFQTVDYPDIKDYKNITAKIVIGTLCIYTALKFNFRFMVAPPMLVAFTEFMNRDNKTRRTPVKAVILVTLCALCGTASRYVICSKLGLGLTIAAFAAIVLIAVILERFKLYMPPAAALGILAMLIPESMIIIYPIQIFAGMILLMGIAILYNDVDIRNLIEGSRKHSFE